MSTAKSMATSYLNGKRAGQQAKPSSLLAPTSQQQRFKSSSSNLSTHSHIQGHFASSVNQKSRLKSTSMSNLLAGGEQERQSQAALQSRIQRPVSRNALDSIHNGMNAKYAQVQSKVYLQNIKPPSQQQQQPQPQPQQQVGAGASKIPGSRSPLQPLQPADTSARRPRPLAATKATGDRGALQAKAKALQEELEVCEREREQLRCELERERADKAESLKQLKLELQEKLAEHDKQNEEYHQKLLEAYELADQNRRAADSVLSESRQRDEESRKKIEELETQLSELREFVTMKEELTGKMYELREQIREERERYEEQLKSLHQVFENEKIR